VKSLELIDPNYMAALFELAILEAASVASGSMFPRDYYTGRSVPAILVGDISR
jgi:hypothetical protein